jgi:hypothetical protein
MIGISLGEYPDGSFSLLNRNSSVFNALPQFLSQNRISVLGDSLITYNNYFIVPDSVVRTSGVAVVTYAAVHGFSEQSKIRVFGVSSDPSFNSGETRITRISATQFSYSSPGVDGAAVVSATYTRILSINNVSNNSIFLYASGYLGGALKLVANLGQSSETTAQILLRVNDVVLSGCDECWVLAGTNDPGNGLSPSQTKNNLKTIYDTLRANGIFVRALTIPPLGAGNANLAAYMPHYQQVNHWIRQYVKTYSGVALADVFSALTDPATATGCAKVNSLLSDNTHWNTYGAILAGAKIAASYSGQITPIDILTKSQSDSYATNVANPNIWLGAPWIGTGGSVADVVTGVAGTGFRVTSAGNAARVAVASCPARSDGFGFDQRVVFTPAAAGDVFNVTQNAALTARVVASREYVLRANLNVTGVVGSSLSYLRAVTTGTFGGVLQDLGSAMKLVASGANSVNSDIVNLTIESPAFVIPPGLCTGFDVTFMGGFAGVGTAVTFNVGRVSLDRVDIDAQ